ncbi:greglin-like isoform X2 [Schistocerca gregaria]|uniref:greglin-like isoform X2 n=1 Tax=Schistocerca gregaria TaxID=7010 RepID=UPI00211EF999|nr:greglin-like isoform X2 [Schistocerca gregaria]
MKAALVVLAVVAVVAVCDARWRPTTARPCDDRCTLEYSPVCVRDPDGAYYLFSNECFLRVCRCRTDVEFTRLDDSDECPSDAATKCPDQLRSPGGAYGDSVEAPESQSDASDSSEEGDSNRRRHEQEERYF